MIAAAIDNSQLVPLCVIVVELLLTATSPKMSSSVINMCWFCYRNVLVRKQRMRNLLCTRS